MKLATGRLGWTPAVALAADPIVIELAWKGYGEEREELERMLFASSGNPLPPRPRELEEGEVAPSLSAKWRTIARQHNTVFRQNNAARARREARPTSGTIRQDG